MIYEAPRFLNSGDQYLTIEIGDEMSLEANFRVVGLDRAIKDVDINGVIETLPGWRSILLHYDSLVISTADMVSEIRRVAESVTEVSEVPSRLGAFADISSR